MSPFGFIPRFTKEADTPKGREVISISDLLLDDIINTIYEDKNLYKLLKEYAHLVRREEPIIDSNAEIEMRKVMIPKIYRTLMNYGIKYTIFTADIEEEVYRRIEKSA